MELKRGKLKSNQRTDREGGFDTMLTDRKQRDVIASEGDNR